MIGGELSAVEKSLQFEAAFQGELFKSCDDGFNEKKNKIPVPPEQLNPQFCFRNRWRIINLF